MKQRRRTSQKSKQGALLSALAGYDRVQIVVLGFAFLCGIILFRLFTVQLLQHSSYTALASSQHELVKVLEPVRGEIFAQDPHGENGTTLIATNQSVYTIFANPQYIKDPADVAKKISPILSLDPAVVEGLLTQKEKVYVQLLQSGTTQQVTKLQELSDRKEIQGIDWLPEDGRLYPHGAITSAMTGFLGYVDDIRKGQYGLEEGMEKELAGLSGKFEFDTDASGQYHISVGKHDIIKAKDGDDIYTTIDINVQNESCRLMEEAVKKQAAKKGTIIVMNPKTGAILALCNVPHYDPNEYNKITEYEVLNNQALLSYESGSVFKTFAYAAAINEGTITPYTTYEDTGEIKIGGITIKNSDKKAHGIVDMTEALAQSYNTGSIFAVNAIGNEKWKEYIDLFSFGKAFDIGFPIEEAGNLEALRDNRDIDSWSASFGQGITVTPLQMIAGYSAIANDGKLMKPHIVERVVDPQGNQKVTEPTVLSEPISAETARTVSAMLVKVVDAGHGMPAAIDGYFIAGKTGTAQIPLEDGSGYHPYKHNDTFVGFFPVSDPQVAILVKMDDPTNAPWAEQSVAPVFGDLAQYLVNYMQIPPDREIIE